jgi:hypothetical protein
VSSGLSFRNLPDASLLAIRQICTHYEKKCSGKVGLMGSSLIFCPAGGLSLLKGNLQPCLTLTPTPPQYSAKSLASRYIFQMSREILSQLQAMSHNAGGAGQRVRDLESILQGEQGRFRRNDDDLRSKS